MFYPDGKMRIVLQAESIECGLACLAMIGSHFERRESLSELRRRFPVSLNGTSLKSLISISDSLGFSPRAVRCDIDELGKLDMPCVLHWDLDHYVVLQKVDSKHVTIIDPARGRRKLPIGEVSGHFTGVALELTPAPNFERKKTPEKVAISDLWSRMSGFKPILAQLFFLTLILQAFALIMPVANQIVIDDVMGRGDKDMLMSIIVGFAVIAVVQTAVDLLRNFIQLHAGQRLSMQLAGNLLKHMLRLPTDFFERRHVGDILSRYGSLDPIQKFLTGGIIGVGMDIIMVVPAAVIMVMYSRVLSLLIILDILIVVVVSAATFGRNRRFTEEAIALSSKTQSIFLETLRAVRAIKISGRETERHGIWQNALTEQMNLSFKQSVFNLWGSSGFSLIMVIQGLLMLYLGATAIMKGDMTLGMFMAFQSYAGQFSDRTKSLIGQFFTFRMLGLHLERLGDIIHADQEVGIDGGGIMAHPMRGELEIRGVEFRYSPQDPWILRKVNLHVKPGEKVVLIGASGGGKSTLLKLLTGLYQPVEGEFLIDGRPLRSLGLKAYRDQIGVVMQDDQLLSGTIADNIAFFDAQIDITQVEDVCRLACIHEEIIRLPMGYHSLIGDMGSVLSGGQKQRVLLARALYRRPAVLFMDEGTANLDTKLEEQILENLTNLGITQIMVAHRQAAIEFADRAYVVCEGEVIHAASNDLSPRALA